MTVAVLDACVLYPPSLRDLLMWLATNRVYAPRLTEEIHSEWTRNVLADNVNVAEAQLDRTRRLMNQVVPDCLVSDYETRIATITLPDPNDRHVLAAAIESGAELIVTYNVTDFPDSTLRQYNVKASHPDVFLHALFEEDEALFLRTVKAHRASLINPSKDPTEYIDTLRTNRLVELAFALEEATDKF